MSVTININGSIILDQSAGLQAPDEVSVGVTQIAGPGNDILTGNLDSDFLSFLNGLNPTLLTDSQKAFADLVEGASDPNLVTVTVTAGETVKSLFFSDAAGNDFTGQQVIFNGNPLQTVDGANIYLWSADNGHVVLASTSNVDASSGSLVAAFYIESSDATNTAAKVEQLTFIPIAHPDPTDPNDSINFTDMLKVSATVLVSTSVGGDIIVNDDGPTIVTSDDSVTLTVDESNLGLNATASFAGEFISDPGTDGPGGAIQYSLSTLGGDSGLVDTATGEQVVLSESGGVVSGKTAVSGLTVFTISVASNGDVTLDQQRAVVHADPNDPNDSVTLASDDLVQLHALISDADGDPATAALNIGQNMFFLDDGPAITTTGTPPIITVDETALGVSASGNFAPNFVPVSGADGTGSITFDLGVTAGPIAGLTDSETGEAVVLSKVGAEVQGRTAIGNLLVFTVDVDATGNVTFDQVRSVTHADASDPNDSRTLGAADLVTLTETIVDKDGDSATATLNIGQDLVILDDGPTVTVPSSAPDAAHAAHLGNQAGQSVTGQFGYDIGADDHIAAFYAAGGSDFVDANPAEAGVQITLTGTVNGPPVTAITQTDVTLFSEDASQATFNWSFHYDKDPITAGVQDGTATGTLVFDKAADTFTLTDLTPVQGFSFDVIHTSELLAKEPTSNVGHPEIVVEKLASDDPATPAHEGFFVQFTGNNSPFSFTANGEGTSNDTSFTGTNHDMFSSGNETWVSATQSTNGVAGDTIQKGEALTLRFFDHSPGIVSEDTSPNQTASGVEVKFDGIGNSEDLMINLDLIDFGADGVRGGTGVNADTTVTRALYISNADIYKTGQVPAPYNTEFTLDNNDGLVIIESNDYNATGEHFQIQGMQILQSANGMTGSAIDLNRAVGAAGGSSTTTGLQPFDPLDNDVLKITDIGFLQSTSGTQTANLDFAFNVADADLDLLGVQHIAAQLSNGFII